MLAEKVKEEDALSDEILEATKIGLQLLDLAKKELDPIYENLKEKREDRP